MSVTDFPLERRMSVEEHFRLATIERRRRLWTPPNGRRSSDLDVLSAPALRKVQPYPPPPPVIDVAPEWALIHTYAQGDRSEENPIIPSAFAQSAEPASEIFDATNPPLIDGETVYPISIRDIARAACRCFAVSMLDLVSSRRTASIVRPRQIAMYLAREMTTRSLPDIGRRMGGKDHTTVLHAWQKLSAQILTDEHLAAEVENVRREAMRGRVPTAKPIEG